MVTTGLDRLLEDAGTLAGRNVGLIANQTSLTSDCRYSWEALRSKGVRLKRIFSPEHGLFATEQDQVAIGREPETGIETISLYGDAAASLVPEEALLEGLDLVLFDIQDVGSRYYTYINTLALFMEAVAGKGIEVMVLDRPNPLGGSSVEGPMLEAAFHSFVGVYPVPVRHGLTAGELAHLYRDSRKLDVQLSVQPMAGWQRQMLFPDTGLPWIPPSPNMPTFATAQVYPGLCLFEGLNVSEGRGTTTPFLLSGAPFIEPFRLAGRCREYGLPGVRFRPTWFRPTFQKYAGKTIGGIWLQVDDARAFRPFATGVAMTAAIRELWGDQLTFLRGVYEFNALHPAFDLLTGSDRIRKALENGRSVDELVASWSGEEAAFAALKPEFHLYQH